MEKKKILFVCLGNICRSPSAEAVFNGLIERDGLQDFFVVDSAGITDYHAGSPADARMQRHAIKRGYNLTSISRPVDPVTDFREFDMIIGMDNQNIRDLEQLATGSDAVSKIFKMTDFCNNCNHDEVPDPYYGGDEGFELVLDLLESACKGLLGFLKNQK
ncbi:protein tyrosine phosphatase [Marinilabilia salmonicolor]|jgi:protein-tyrosine phosphatase|uniref:low molecular weight protein-tyrosine-phosphatase n=1 Tax=Marinilabilia salmonicolor TaxID=989 RepID=UPI000D08132C|nr:low molecular weight protein-tyrosine-phosphatase [Marinilabilia salmonicolor]PRY95942.1 protein tyrosine phosphatase [Marinilabilia salmonicolor]